MRIFYCAVVADAYSYIFVLQWCTKSNYICVALENKIELYEIEQHGYCHNFDDI